jgi:4,5-DOPA dioxygenase extradiol
LTDLLHPDIPGAAFDAFLPAAVAASRAQAAWTPADGPLPSLYLSHGAPPVFDDPVWMDEFLAWALSMPKPKAILIVSAHWEQAPLMLSATAANTPLVYDFGGFAPRYYQMEYRTPDASALARQVVSALSPATTVYEHTRRGLDHGAWVPLKVMYPLGDVPVLQLSMPTEDPDTLLALGARLRPLREHGVLIIGSGFTTHSFEAIRRYLRGDDSLAAHIQEFDHWVAEALSRGDVDTLAAYQSKAPAAAIAHPTVDHFVPMFVTLGAASRPDAPLHTAIAGIAMGNSKRSFQIS